MKLETIILIILLTISLTFNIALIDKMGLVSEHTYAIEKVEIKQCVWDLCRDVGSTEDWNGCGEGFNIQTDYYDGNMVYHVASSTYKYCFKEI